MKNLLSKSVMTLSLMSLASCNPSEKENTTITKAITIPAPVAATINDVKWLVGFWQNVTVEEKYFEQWTQVNETTLSGQSGSIKGTDTTITATVTIEQVGNDLLCTPVVKNQNDAQPAVSYKLTAITGNGNSFVFENPAHDFPQKITYTKKSANILLAKMSGKINGKPHTELFPRNKFPFIAEQGS